MRRPGARAGRVKRRAPRLQKGSRGRAGDDRATSTRRRGEEPPASGRPTRRAPKRELRGGVGTVDNKKLKGANSDPPAVVRAPCLLDSGFSRFLIA